MAKAQPKLTKQSATKAKNKINKPAKPAKAPKAAARGNTTGPYRTTINPDTCTCKSQTLRSPPGGCKHIKDMRAAAIASATAPAPVSAPAPAVSGSVSVNPISGLVGKGHVLQDGGEIFDMDLGFTDANKNSNKFYKIQIVEATNRSKYWFVQNWGRIGTQGQEKTTEYSSKGECLKAFHKKFKEKAGVEWGNRAQANSNAHGKYRTMTEMRVAQSGGRIADDKTVCFCLSWNDRVDLDIHCVMPNGDSCFFGNKNPAKYISLDVDKQAHHFGSQVENIFLEANNCPDGKYRYFVRYFTGHGRPTPFTFVLNQFDKVINEGVSICCPIK
jgi:predicted DNA-binding WGR domain protein